MERMPQCKGGGNWTDPTMGGAIAEAGKEDIETYISSRQNTVAQFILNRPILDLYMKEEPQTGAQVEK